MNPVWVVDLGFVLPLALLTAVRLVRYQSGAERVAGSFLVFDALLAVSILLMATSSGLAGQALQVPMIAIFLVLLVVSTTLSWLALGRQKRGHAKASLNSPGRWVSTPTAATTNHIATVIVRQHVR